MSNLFDEVTGTPAALELDEQVEEACRAEVAEAQLVEKMAATAGWKIIEEYLFDQINKAKEKLIDAKEIDEIRQLQLAARMYSNVIGRVHHAIEISRESRASAATQLPISLVP